MRVLLALLLALAGPASAATIGQIKIPIGPGGGGGENAKTLCLDGFVLLGDDATTCVDPATQAELNAHEGTSDAHHTQTVDTNAATQCVTGDVLGGGVTGCVPISSAYSGDPSSLTHVCTGVNKADGAGTWTCEDPVASAEDFTVLPGATCRTWASVDGVNWEPVEDRFCGGALAKEPVACNATYPFRCDVDGDGVFKCCNSSAVEDPGGSPPDTDFTDDVEMVAFWPLAADSDDDVGTAHFDTDIGAGLTYGSSTPPSVGVNYATAATTADGVAFSADNSAIEVDPISLGCWVRSQVPGVNQEFFDNSSGNYGYELRVGNLNYTTMIGSGSDLATEGTPFTYTVTDWHFVAMRASSSDTTADYPVANTAEIFVDGEQACTGACDVLSPGSFDPNSTLATRLAYSGSGAEFDGDIVHCGVINKLLSDEEMCRLAEISWDGSFSSGIDCPDYTP